MLFPNQEFSEKQEGTEVEAVAEKVGPAVDAAAAEQLRQGLRDGVPIGLGYFPVSFTFGLAAVAMGLPVWVAVAISATNLTSAGQFAGLELIAAGGSMVEMALTQLVINIRYALMSLSLSQKLDRRVTRPQRLLISHAITDEIFGVASARPGRLTAPYLFGLISIPVAGWLGGTLVGAAAGGILPASVSSALGIAIYGMFIAIIIPACRSYRPVLLVTAVAVVLSCLAGWLVPGLSSGFSIILCALVAAGLGAKLFPVQEEEAEEEAQV